MNELDKSMIAIANQNNLTTINVGIHLNGQPRFTATIHWLDEDGLHDCAIEHGDTIAEALGFALARKNAQPCVIEGELAA